MKTPYDTFTVNFSGLQFWTFIPAALQKTAAKRIKKNLCHHFVVIELQLSWW